MYTYIYYIVYVCRYIFCGHIWTIFTGITNQKLLDWLGKGSRMWLTSFSIFDVGRYLNRVENIGRVGSGFREIVAAD